MNETTPITCLGWPVMYGLQDFPAMRVCVLITSIINGLFAVPAVLLNSLVILTVVNTRTLRTPSNILLCNLAITDCVIGLLLQPLYISARALELYNGRHEYCTVRIIASCLTHALPLSLILTLTAMSLDRYLAIRLMLQYRTKVTSPRVLLVIIALWSVVLLGGSSPAFYRHEVFITSLAVLFLLCLLVTFAAYFCAFRGLHQHQIRVNTTSQDACTDTVCINVKKYRRSFTTMLCVFLLQLFCYTPDICSKLLSVTYGISPAVSVAIVTADMFVFINATLNPVLYFWRMREVRRASLRIIRRLCKPKEGP